MKYISIVRIWNIDLDTYTSSETAYDRDQLDQLVEATARQNRQAFAELFAFYAPRVKSYLLRLNSSDSLAEELTQEVMLTVWRKASQFDSNQASASTWIFRIARNRRIDAARRANKPELSAEEPTLLPPEPEAPDMAAHATFRSSRIQDAMSTLPDEQITLLQMAFFDGLSHREIADKLDVPLGTVKSRLRLAFDKMRKLLDENDL